jgi:NhaA family Na+:H+ antiporter
MRWLRGTQAGHWRETPLARVLSPLQRFIHSEVSGGVALMAATALALLIANSPLADAYHAALKSYVSLSAGPLALRLSVEHWVNDGLMALFFFVVGLELKREALVGELADPRQALLPILAATGGALAPALIYTLINRGGPGSAGWGVPMATDIAFALGVLALLGDRVPWTLKVFLTAVAVIDDLLAVLVIALFYSSGLSLAALGLAAAGLALLALANVAGIRHAAVTLVLGLLVWLAVLQSGLHATVAGVLVALTVPARSRIDAEGFLARAGQLLEQFAHRPASTTPMLTDELQQSAVLALEDACEEVQAPLQKLEHTLHPWVAFGIVPIFALANAGVALSPGSASGAGGPVAAGVVLGLVLGKPAGLLGTTWVLVRLGVARLPAGVGWGQMAGAGCLAGLGFTMSLFIATLGLGEPALLEAAKLGILAASLIAGLLGFVALRRSPAVEPAAEEPSS